VSFEGKLREVPKKIEKIMERTSLSQNLKLSKKPKKSKNNPKTSIKVDSSHPSLPQKNHNQPNN
jgi:hypothetical protein